MASRSPEVVKISSPSDIVCVVAQLLGFTPTESVVVACTHGPRNRFGLVMRFDIELADKPADLAAIIEQRTRREDADGVFVVVFTAAPMVDGMLPFSDLIERVVPLLDERLMDAYLVAGDRWWSYLCADLACCGAAGTVVDLDSPNATAIAAAYALVGHGVLPDRDALVRSVGYDGPDPPVMGECIESALRRHDGQSEAARRLAAGVLVERLGAELVDPRGSIADEDAAELVALCVDVIVRDEVMVRASKRRRRQRLLPVLRAVARRTPPPHDAAICAMLAWVAYADGDGALANIAVERSLSTDPDYSLAWLIVDSLHHQVPPAALQEVMREAARDLRGRSATG